MEIKNNNKCLEHAEEELMDIAAGFDWYQPEQSDRIVSLNNSMDFNILEERLAEEFEDRLEMGCWSDYSVSPDSMF